MPEDATAVARRLLDNKEYYETFDTRLTVQMSLGTPSEVAGTIRHVNNGGVESRGNVVFGEKPYRLTIDLDAGHRADGTSLKVYDTGSITNEKLGNATTLTTERVTDDTDP